MVTNTNQTPLADTPADQLDHLFDLLADRQRRYVLQRLRTADKPVSVTELVTEISAWEEAPPPETDPAVHHDSIATSLLHSQLPKLADAGLIEYNQSTGTVAYTEHPQFETVVTQLSEAFPTVDESERA